ncbi:aromatic acid/H+ symport family MFS transporter [Pseudonocardia ailaonensis]|uniref:Aromatic acid/H+ symport family MFS transporter n=1 Tax=Pseudonocardia ailaonensis TaxID=367279 RepID=A0ABN2NNU4_9PSEU
MKLAEHTGATSDRGRTLTVVLCMIVTIIEGYNLIVFGSVVPLLLADPTLGITDSQLGLIGGVVYIGAVLGSLLAPVVAERLGKKATLAAAISIFAVGAAVAGLAVSGGMLGAARLLSGIGVGAALTTAMTIARNNAPQGRASLIVTVTMAGIPLGGVVAALLAIPILPTLGWRAMFFVGSGFAVVILACVLAGRLPRTAQETAGSAWSIRQKLVAVFAGRGAAVATVIAVCAIANMIAWQGLNVWAAQSMIDLGFSLSAALLFTFALTGAAVLGSFATAWAADRSSSAVVSIATGSCTLLGLLGILLLPLSVPTAIVSVALMGIGGHSTMNLVHTTTSGIYPLPARATAMGWSNGTSFIGAFLGPTLGGIAVAGGGAYGIFGAFAIAAAACLAGVIGLFLLDRTATPASFRGPAAGQDSPELDAAPPVAVIT